MDKWVTVGIFCLVVALSGCAPAVSVTSINTPTIVPSTPPLSGIEGYVTIGPMCPGPVAIGDTRCLDQPYQAMIIIFDTHQKEVSRFQTDAAGYFKITLEPGTYTLHPESDKVLPRAADQTITVAANQFTQVSVMYDTGMR
jgi:hypothetical protein